MPKQRKRPRAVREPGSPLPASQFKARCLELMDYVRATGAEIVITKHGTPVAKLVPVKAGTRDPFGYLRGSVTYMGDIVSPIGDPWDAEQG